MKISKKNSIRIIVSIAILVVILSLFFIKNKSSNESIEKGEQLALEVTSPLDIEQLKKYNLPIIIDFGADSCAPCREMAPVLEKLHGQLQGKAIILFVDVWKYPELSEGFPIRVIPTQIFIDNKGNPYTPSESSSLRLMMLADKESEEHLMTFHEGGLTEEMMLEVLKDMGLEDD